MDNVSDGIQFLCNDIIAGHDARKITLTFVKDDSNTIRGCLLYTSPSPRD